MKFNFGIPEILKINSVSNLNKLKIKIGNDVIRCATKNLGFSFFNKNTNGINEIKKINI